MIIRVPSEDRESFTIVSNELIADPSVSLKAVGVYCYLLSKPSDWTIRGEDITAVFRGNGGKKIGRKSVFNALKELEQEGYIERVILGNESVVKSTVLYESNKPEYQKTKTYLANTGNRVIRLNREDRSRFTVISNETLKKPELSLRSLGLYCYMLSQKDKWRFTYKDISKALSRERDKNIGVKRIKTAIGELENKGYSERVRTGKGLFSMNSDIVIYESSKEDYKLSLWERKKLEKGETIDLQRKGKNEREFLGFLSPDLVVDCPLRDFLSRRATNGDIIISTIKNKDCNITKTENDMYYVVDDEKRFPVTGIGLGLSLKNTGSNPTIKKKDLKDKSDKTEEGQDTNDSTKDFSHVKGQSMSRTKKNVERLTKALRNLHFPTIISSDYRKRKIIGELNDEYEGKWLLSEDNYELIQTVLNETAKEINSKTSSVEWAKGAHVLIKNRLIELLDQDEIEEAVAAARTQEQIDIANYYQNKLDRWDRLCRESDHVNRKEALDTDLRDEIIAFMIFSQSPEDKDNLHTERCIYWRQHSVYSEMLKEGVNLYTEISDEVKAGALNILASRKGIDDLPSFLSEFEKEDLADVIPDYENFKW